MSGVIDNDIFRIVYCALTDSAQCDGGGLLPAEWSWVAYAIAAVVIGFIVVTIALTGTLIFLWVERRLLARFQNRTGPNRWGPFGLLTPIADAVKLIFKEDLVPREADRLLYSLAPIFAMVSAILVFGFLPFGEGFFLVDVSVGLLFIFGVTGLNSLATLMASWASGNRISVFSGLRSGAILISYEIPAALSLVGIILLSGTLSLNGIVSAQTVPFILVQPLAFFVFFVTSLAEVNRTPFDLTEAESELGAGHLNDYSSMKFGLLFIAEYTATVASAALITALFLSGWRGFEFLPGPIWFGIKTLGVLFVINWLRSSWPRFRVDQMLQIAWKGLFELTLVNIAVMLVLLAIFPDPTTTELWLIAGINWIVFIVTLLVLSTVLTRMRKKRARVQFDRYPVGSMQGGSE